MNGWLILDKPQGITSAHALNKLKYIIGVNSRKKNAPKVGHAGTLDPLATGILPVAIGEATKASQFAMDRLKSYRFTIAWGEFRTTDDTEGEVTGVSDKRPTEAEIKAALPRFTGIILQTPPAFSAVKVAGERAYALARAGEQVVLAPREVLINYINIIEINQDNAVLEMECGKGTYVRSIARDLALALGTAGHISAIRRLSVGPFNEAGAISLEKLAEMVHKGELASAMQPVDAVLDDIPALDVPPGLAAMLRRGQAVLLPANAPLEGLVRVYSRERLSAVCEIAEGQLLPVRVFNL